MNLDDYMTAPEVAASVGINVKALYKRIDRGRVPHKKVGRRTILIHRDVVSNLEADHRYIDGRREHPLYPTYMNMLRRCYNPKCKNFPRYGGRGIRVCKRWREDFWSFVSDIGDKPGPRCSISRKNNNGNYTPNNCRWETPEDQVNGGESRSC